jgi:gamma-D-glutamyl-L-lysine dipeptidyl-peptidase
MFYRSLLAAAIMSMTAACAAQPRNPMINDLIKEARQKMAPDSRTAIFNVTAEASGDSRTVTLKGEMQNAAMKEQLLQFLRSKGDLQIADSIMTFPDKRLGDSTYALVSVSVANIRTKPDHDNEMASQALLGTPVRVLKRRGSWYLIQTPDQYLGWTIDRIVRMNREGYRQWCERPKVIATAAFGFTHVAPDKESDNVSDYAVGCLFALKGQKDQWFEVEYPDGRVAFLPKDEAAEYSSWLSQAADAPDRITRTAKRFLGIPYLWGGTSSKGLDCSGFTKTVFFLNGTLLPRDASQQFLVGEPIDTSNGLALLKPGDLVFFGSKATTEKPQRVTHVGLYLGEGKFIHAPGAASAPGISVNSFRPTDPEYDEHRHEGFLGARRVIGKGNAEGIRHLNTIAYYNNHGD